MGRYLTDSLMDEELLSMRHFELYEPLDTVSSSQDAADDDTMSCSMTTSQSSSSTDVTVPGFIQGRHRMVLDAVTLANLDILENAQTGSTEGTLLSVLDQGVTPFGG